MTLTRSVAAESTSEAHVRSVPFFVTLSALGGLAAVASAEPSGAPDDQLTVPAGHGVVRALVGINLSKDAAGKPISLSPDLWYGATDRVSVGLLHSARGTSGFLGGVGQSLCLSGQDNGCADVYSNVGVAARIRLDSKSIATAVEAGVFASSLDPFTIAGKLGLAARWRSDKVAIEAAPSIFIGLNERDAGNQEVAAVPVTLSYAATPEVSLAVQSGLVLPFESTGDTFSVPLSIGAQLAVSGPLSLEASFSFLVITGGDAVPTGADLRTLAIGGGYAF